MTAPVSRPPPHGRSALSRSVPRASRRREQIGRRVTATRFAAPIRPGRLVRGSISPPRRFQRETLGAHAVQPPPHPPISVKIIQAGDSQDHQRPSRQRHEGEAENLRPIGCGLQEAAVIPAFAETAEIAVRVITGGGIGIDLIVIIRDDWLELFNIEPTADRVDRGRNVGRRKCIARCRMLGGRWASGGGNRLGGRWSEREVSRIRIVGRERSGTGGLHDHCRCHGDGNHVDGQAYQLDLQLGAPGRSAPAGNRSRLRRLPSNAQQILPAGFRAPVALSGFP
jgi:hypothetical protein